MNFRKWLRKKVVQYLVKNLLVAVQTDDLLIPTNKGLYIGNRKLEPDEVSQLKEDAKMIQESFLWTRVRAEVKFVANLRMFEKSAEGDSSIFGRAMLYNFEIIEQFLDKLKNY